MFLFKYRPDNRVRMYHKTGIFSVQFYTLMENECEALPGVAYPGVRDNRSTINTKTGYDDDDYTQKL